MNEKIADHYEHQKYVRRAEIRRDDAYKALGIYVYEMTKRGQISDPRIEELAGRIDLIIDEVVSTTADASKAQKEEARVVEEVVVPEAVEEVVEAMEEEPMVIEEIEEPQEEEAEEEGEPEELEEPHEPELLERALVQEEHEALLIECPYCGEEVELGSAFCLFCGKSLEQDEYERHVSVAIKETGVEGDRRGEGQPEPLLCPHCGDELEEGVVFCITCGKEVAASQDSGVPNETPVNVQEREVIPHRVDEEEDLGIGEIRTCPHCGDEIEEDTVFCLSCGKKVEEEPGFSID